MDVFSGEPVLALRGVSHRYHGRAILDDVALTVHQGNRIGLLGVNGTGKSTLLRVLAGAEPPDGGEVTRARGLRLTYLPQEALLDPGHTVRQAVEVGLAETRDLLARYEALGHRMADDPAALAEHERLRNELDHRDGWTLDTDVDRIMAHLQVPDATRVVGELSGGERRRVALCQALVARPDALLLDEPTNHLDAATILWLEEFLASYRGSVILVTHDRYFLDRVADRMVELDGGKLQEYVGNYSDYLEHKALAMAIEARSEEVRRNTLRRELEWARKQPKARSTKQQARVDRYEDLLAKEPPPARGDVELVLPYGPRLGTKVLRASGLTKRIGGRTLFEGLELDLQAGDRLGIVGPNGAGKTTLMRLLMGHDAPDAGTVEIGPTIRFLYADQGRALLDPEKTVLAEVAGDSEWITVGDRTMTVRTYLKRFLFDDVQAATPIKRLSGGEQNRVQLAKLLRAGGNVLILDEPTNDLDLVTLRVLEEALVDFPGCVLAVSHDRYFLNRVATGILAFEGDGRVVHSLGSYDRYLEGRREPVVAATPRPTVITPVAPLRPETRKLTYKEAKELETLPEAIEEAESRVAELERTLSDPALYAERGEEVPAMLEAAEAARREVERLYSRWQELEALPAR